MKVLVLGGTGFVGFHAVAALAAAGHEVTSLARSADKAQALEKLGSKTVAGDVVTANAGLADAMRRSDVVMSLAGPTFLGRMSVARSRRLAVEWDRMAEATLAAIKAAGNPPLVIAEGTMGYGDTNGKTADESWPYAFDCGHGRLMALTVPRYQRAVEVDGVRLTKVIVGGAYGAGSWFRESMVSLARRGRLGVFGDGSNVWSLVHVDDVAQLLRLVAEQHPPGESFIAVDDEPCTARQLADFVAQKVGRPGVRAFPRWLGRILLGRVLAEALAMGTQCTNAKARRVLDWKLRYPSFREGVPPVIAELLTG